MRIRLFMREDKMSEKKQWFENENFWNNYGPIMFDANRWSEAPAVANYHISHGVVDAAERFYHAASAY